VLGFPAFLGRHSTRTEHAGHVSTSHLDCAHRRCFTSWVIFYGLATWECQSVEEFFLTREEAEDGGLTRLGDRANQQERTGQRQYEFRCQHVSSDAEVTQRITRGAVATRKNRVEPGSPGVSDG
jgi:hypothetical protein